jgi:hypothetical protein
VHRIDGIDIADLTHACQTLAGVEETKGGSLEDRLKALINKARVMIFMKGNREAPRYELDVLINVINRRSKIRIRRFRTCF